MIEIPFEKRATLAPLFQRHIRQRVIIDAILEQPYGQAFSDSENNPQIARLQLGAFKLFAGDPHHPLAEKLITTSPRGLLITETDTWKNRILDLLGEHCSTYLRTGFSFKQLNRNHVHKLAQKIPEGYRIQPFNKKYAESEYTETAYTNAEILLQNGTGFCTLQNDQIASIAVAYTNHGIEIQIYTHDDHQQKGLATCTSATLIAHCLDHNINPHWSAANTISANLAQKLGYIKNDQYDAIVYRPQT